MKIIKDLASILCILLTVLYLNGCTQHLFYYPDNINYGFTPVYYKQPFDNLIINSQDGTQLNAWFIPSSKHQDSRQAIGTVIFMHGNAANMTMQYHAVSWLSSEGFNVFIFDYRGFGLSKGEPNFKGVYQDTDAAITFIRHYEKVNPEKLVILTQSIGGSSAVASVANGNKQGIKAMVIDSSFYSYSSIANDYLWGSGLIVSNTYSANRHIAKLSPIPILLLHGLADTIVPAKHSQWLYDEAKEPKQLELIPNKQHITALNETAYQTLVVQFFKKHLTHLHPQTKE